MPLFEITTLSQFKMTYFIEAESMEDALDEHTMNVELVEASQEHLGEIVVDGRKINHKKFQKWISKESQNPDAVSSYWMGEKLINKIDYDTPAPQYFSAAMDQLSQQLQQNMNQPDIRANCSII